MRRRLATSAPCAPAEMAVPRPDAAAHGRPPGLSGPTRPVPRPRCRFRAWDAQDQHGFAREENKRQVGRRTRRRFARHANPCTPPPCRLAESSDLCGWRTESATPAARCRSDGRLCASHENALGLPGGWVAAAAGRPAGGWQGGRHGPAGRAPGARHGAAGQRPAFLSDVIVASVTARPEPRTARGGPSRASGAATILANASAGARMTGNWAAPGGAGSPRTARSWDKAPQDDI
jgi:hypothetical protein